MLPGLWQMHYMQAELAALALALKVSMGLRLKRCSEGQSDAMQTLNGSRRTPWRNACLHLNSRSLLLCMCMCWTMLF